MDCLRSACRAEGAALLCPHSRRPRQRAV